MSTTPRNNSDGTQRTEDTTNITDIIKIEQFNDIPIHVIGVKEKQIPLGDIARAIGYSRQALHNIVNRYPEIFVKYRGVNVTLTPSGGGEQETICLSTYGVVALLNHLDYRRIDDPVRRQRIVDFQIWCVETIGRMMDGEIPIIPQARWIDTAEQHLKLAKGLMMQYGLRPDISLKFALDQTYKETGKDLSDYNNLLESASGQLGTSTHPFLKTSTAKQRKIVRLLAQGLSQADISREVPISRQYVNKFLTECISRGFITRNEPDTKSQKITYTVSDLLKEAVDEIDIDNGTLTFSKLGTIKKKFTIERIEDKSTLNKTIGYIRSFKPRGPERHIFQLTNGEDRVSLVVHSNTLMGYYISRRKITTKVPEVAEFELTQKLNQIVKTFAKKAGLNLKE